MGATNTTARFLKCDFSYSRAAVQKILTEEHRVMLLVAVRHPSRAGDDW